MVDCSRFPGSWDVPLAAARQAADRASLQVAWDVVLSELEAELCARRDKVDGVAKPYLGRAGPQAFR